MELYKHGENGRPIVRLPAVNSEPIPVQELASHHNMADRIVLNIYQRQRPVTYKFVRSMAVIRRGRRGVIALVAIVVDEVTDTKLDVVQIPNQLTQEPTVPVLVSPSKSSLVDKTLLVHWLDNGLRGALMVLVL